MQRGINKGFTVVELLIVVVVIAILAAISIVAYSGITAQAEESALKSALKTAANKIEIEKINTENYPVDEAALGSLGVETANDQYTLVYTSSPSSTYCISAFLKKNPTKAFSISSTNGEIQNSACTGHTPPTGGGGFEIANGIPIQQITQTQCQALPTYTGSNEEAVRTVTDSRGGTERTYRIAKLADDNCWMLDNLKLGSTSGSITLTPSDSNVATNFTLPQLTTTGAQEYDNPRAYGPVPDDTGSGATNYGYLYNWSAATAGESRTSMPGGSGNSPYSICPANWRLPTGGGPGEFAILNAKMNNPSATEPSISGGAGFYDNWASTGIFKGVFSGAWWEGSFTGQLASGGLWSSSTSVESWYGNSAYSVGFNIDSVLYLNTRDNRDIGSGVRCLLD